MAYDRERKAEIDGMSAGDLVHFMISNYEPCGYGKEPYGQSLEYFWAYERLCEMLPAAMQVAEAPCTP